MTRADEAFIPSPTLPASPRALAPSVGDGNWFMPVIYHPERKTEWIRFERFPRKVKATPEKARTYAERVMGWRELRKARTRRKLEILSSDFWNEFVAEGAR